MFSVICLGFIFNLDTYNYSLGILSVHFYVLAHIGRDKIHKDDEDVALSRRKREGPRIMCSLKSGLKWYKHYLFTQTRLSQINSRKRKCVRDFCPNKLFFKVFLYYSPGTHTVDHADLELKDLPVSAFWVLTLKVCTTMADTKNSNISFWSHLPLKEPASLSSRWHFSFGLCYLIVSLKDCI